MKKLKIVALACCAFALCFALIGCGPSKQSYEGTWDLKYSESMDSEGVPGLQYTEEDMAALNDVDQYIYLTLADDDIAYWNLLGAITNGKWTMDGSSVKLELQQIGVVDPETGVADEVNTVKLTLNGDTLKMEDTNENTIFYFKKGEYKNPYEEQNKDIVVADERGMSILMTSGEPLSNPVTVVDNDDVSIVIDGMGVDSLGDPGYNLQLKNKTTDQLNISIPEKVKVGDKEINAYMYITVNPGMSTTTFLMIDYEELGSTSTDALVDVSGKFLVEKATGGEEVGTFDFEM